MVLRKQFSEWYSTESLFSAFSSELSSCRLIVGGSCRFPSSLAARALIPYVVHDEPQISPGRSADVEETEGMSTPALERGDLQIRNLWKHQQIAFWTCVSRILMHHRTFIGNWKQSFFPRSEIPTSLSRPVTFSPFVVSCDGVLGNEAKV